MFLDDLADGIRHRGPDAFGAWWDRDAGIGLAHRLRSTELTGTQRATTVANVAKSTELEDRCGSVGPPPVVSRSGRWVVVLDGRIHNRVEIRSGLGHPTGTTPGDVGLLAEALDRWGVEAALERLDASFAFAAWDREERRLTLARDPLGQRPLVYSVSNGGIVFASELGALRRVPGFDSSLDPGAVALFLRFKYVPSPHTIHPGAWKLPPGRVLTVSAEQLERGTVPDPRPIAWFADLLHGADRTGPGGNNGLELGATSEIDETGEGWLDHLDSVLVRSVRRLLDDGGDGADDGGDGGDGDGKSHGGRGRVDERGDDDGDRGGMRPSTGMAIGSLLSGGIDSTLVSAIAAEQSATPLRTFTVGSDDPDLDESAEARAIAAHLGAEHTEVPIDGADARNEVPGLASRWDEPFADSSQLPMLLVARLARRDVGTVIVGDGGDELFGGYNRHLWLPATWSKVGRLPAPVRRGTARILAAPSPAAWDRAANLLPARRRPRMVGLKAAKFASLLGAPDVADAYGRLVSHWQDPTSLLDPGFTSGNSSAGGFVEPTTLAHDAGRWPTRDSLAETIMAVDLCTYLPDDVLVKVDRATAAVGLETRTPLLGREVVEASFALPLRHKIADGVGKVALRQLIARRLPPELVERPKSGFGVPIAHWLRTALRPWAEDLLDEGAIRRGGILAPEPIRAAWTEHLGGRVDRSYELWDVLMLLDWIRGLEAGPR